MIDWLLDTLIWTGVLIALVLVVRRPVTRFFGARVAYALWILPALRLILPSIELPAWMAVRADPPSLGAVAVMAPPGTELGPLSDTIAMVPISAAPASAVVEGLLMALVALWLCGAAIFVVRRFNAYFGLRAALLDHAIEAGRTGSVRLIETPATNAPLAFGVIDKVIALPPGFLAQPDRTARDLALAHELAHHQGHDLLSNMLVQPLFALHWFNPLGHYGWLALRRDQEAACDARVMAGHGAETKARYADLIASFAAGPKAALAAPMACPVLGEKSVIHRLRSLGMIELSTRRRLAGRCLIAGAALTLPLTASISYAASEDVAMTDLPPPPTNTSPASATSGTPMAPPAPPSTPAKAPDAIETIDPDLVEEREERREEWIVRVEEQADLQRQRAERERELAERWQEQAERRREQTERRVEAMLREDQGARLKALKEAQKSLRQAELALQHVPDALEEAMAAARDGEGRTVIRMTCFEDDDEVTRTIRAPDGSQIIMLCERRIMSHALDGLREARKAIARNPNMPLEQRDDVIELLNRQIERWENSRG